MYCKAELLFQIDDKFCKYRVLKQLDVSKEYVETLKNDSGYIENKQTSIKAQQEYIRDLRNSKSQLIGGIFANNLLVGTAGIQIDETSATIGILVFEKYRGLGLGKVLVWAASEYAYKVLSKDKFNAGAMVENLPSIRSFISCGFKETYRGNECSLNAGYSQIIKPSSINDFKVLNNDKV